MNSTTNSNNINYTTILVPADSIDSIKQKLGNDFVWKDDEKSNKLYLMQKPKYNTGFLTEISEEMLGSVGYEKVTEKLKNRWDD